MRGFSMNSNGPFLYLYLEFEGKESERFNLHEMLLQVLIQDLNVENRNTTTSKRIFGAFGMITSSQEAYQNILDITT